MTNVTFDPPGPGSWILDGNHLDRPRCGYVSDLLERNATEGFRQGFARYGVLLDTIEFRSVNSLPYMAIRPLGAPPGASGTPPKWLFTLLLRLHPALRRRIKRANEVVTTKFWREDAQRFMRALPEVESSTAAFAREPIEQLPADAFAAHFESLARFASTRIVQHFANVPLTCLPVGDFLVFASEAGISGAEAMATLRGYSPHSVAAGQAIKSAAAAIAADPEARAILDADTAPSNTLSRLRGAGDATARAMSLLLDRYGDAIVSGHDLTGLRVIELPELVVATLRAHVSTHERGGESGVRSDRERASANETLRSRVPASRRDEFDERLRDAREVYPIRDAQSNMDLWALGVMRRALLEAGKRLAANGRVGDEGDVFDATEAEVVGMLRGVSTPTRDELHARVQSRQHAPIEGAPRVLGPVPGAPPPVDWMPAQAGRLARAFAAYRELMEDPSIASDRTVVKGVAASVGRARGPARLVRSVDDFGRLQKGDILVAPTTTPMYNVILPLLAGIVTDRGGLLSHPAIVSREYGFPGIVGTKDATSRIPDGALVEIDGAAGTVTVLAV
ncbi:MAG: PEP-utilizing enzyme [Vicinamibacterales bacterium]